MGAGSAIFAGAASGGARAETAGTSGSAGAAGADLAGYGASIGVAGRSSATAGQSTTGSAGSLIITKATGGVAGSGGWTSLPVAGDGPATDTVGVDPFQRTAARGLVVTNSDGQTANGLQLAATADGGLYVAGATRNPWVLGIGSFAEEIGSEAFIVKLDKDGHRLWGTVLGTCGVPAGITARSSIARVLCPYEPNKTTIAGPTCPTSSVVALVDDRDGRLLHASELKIPASAVGGGFCPTGIGTGLTGRSYVTGVYSDVTQIERAMLVSLTGGGQQDWTLLSSGVTNASDTTPSTRPSDVDVDVNDNVVFVGGFDNSMKLGTTLLSSQAVSGSVSTYNGFIARLSTTASSVVAWRFGGTIFDNASAVKSTPEGGFVVVGQTSGKAMIGGQEVLGTPEGSAFVAQFDANGQARWVKLLPGSSVASDVALSRDGRVHVVGSFEQGELFYSYDPAADLLTSHTVATALRPGDGLRTNAVVVTVNGSIWVAGIFQGSIDLGAGVMTTESEASFLWRAD